MNGYSSYSKIEVVGNEKENSRSIDSSSSDLMSLPETSKTTSNPTTPNPIEKNPEIIKNSNPNSTQDSSDDIQEGNNNNGETMMFGPKLGRNSSVSSAYALQAAVTRAFSMRRSSSVSERYCRIHDQSVTLASSFDDDDDEELDTTRRSMKKKKKKNSRSKILKAWKKLFGL
ncbi:hypothetical protein REPUB_Repub01dG0261200 [Reevesia pubescens]